MHLLRLGVRLRTNKAEARQKGEQVQEERVAVQGWGGFSLRTKFLASLDWQSVSVRNLGRDRVPQARAAPTVSVRQCESSH